MTVREEEDIHPRCNFSGRRGGAGSLTPTGPTPQHTCFAQPAAALIRSAVRGKAGQRLLDQRIP
jgi:hypothetical protein